jgi:hypothetical protein
MLVERGVFQEICVYFLPTGHTHEDIDALFGRLSSHVRKHNSLSLQELGNVMTAASNGDHVDFEIVEVVRWLSSEIRLRVFFFLPHGHTCAGRLVVSVHGEVSNDESHGWALRAALLSY